jgi:hypothetical protein
MARWGYMMMTEQAPPDLLVRDLQAAEEAGFDEIALVQIGADQQKPFFEWAEKEPLPALREL